MEAVLDFPFVQDLPKREKSKLANLWDALKASRADVDAAFASQGGIVPVGLAAQLLNVSKQRVSQLLDEGKLVAVSVHGHRFVGEDSLVALAKSDRKGGRPVKAPSLSESYALAKVMVGKK